jgi:hypothetical protein
MFNFTINTPAASAPQPHMMPQPHDIQIYFMILPLVIGVITTALQIFISLRQANISERQAELAKYQAEIAEHRIRIDLFDQRYEFYEEFYKLLDWITTPADDPSIQRQYWEVRKLDKKVRFLFSETVKPYVDEVLKNAFEYYMNRIAMMPSDNSTMRQQVFDQHKMRDDELYEYFKREMAVVGDKFQHDLDLREIKRLSR